MALTPAPLFDDLAGVPSGGLAYWVTASDGVRLRVALWRPAGMPQGTVLMFPGRTEYIEKYGGLVDELTRRGYATMVIDWRGQGLSDRLLDDARLGHVDAFTHYQRDVAAMLDVARAADLPEPFHLIGHSMGGGIGLRAAMEGLPLQSCVFTGPMWGIYMSPAVKPFGWALSHVAPIMGFGTRLPPTTRYEGYVTAQDFAENALTTDADAYRLMQDHMTARPELGIGGPTLIWLRESLMECRKLALRVSPDLPCLTFLGAGESIIDCDSVRRRMAVWPKGKLAVVEGARHEVLMERPHIRSRIFDQMDALFSSGCILDENKVISA